MLATQESYRYKIKATMISITTITLLVLVTNAVKPLIMMRMT